MNLFNYIGLVIMLVFSTNKLAAQTTTFNVDPGQWTTAGNWSNGLPNNTIDVVINGVCRTSFGAGDCKDLDILLGRRLVVAAGVTINVFGELNFESTGTLILNGGEIIVSNNMLVDNVGRIEVAGSVQFYSNFDIGQ